MLSWSISNYLIKRQSGRYIIMEIIVTVVETEMTIKPQN